MDHQKLTATTRMDEEGRTPAMVVADYFVRTAADYARVDGAVGYPLDFITETVDFFASAAGEPSSETDLLWACTVANPATVRRWIGKTNPELVAA